MHFELHKATQQYADVLTSQESRVGSNLIDFSSDYRVGLFFSAFDPEESDTNAPGALIIVDPTILDHIEESLTSSDENSLILAEFKQDLEKGIPKSDFPYYRVRSYIPCARTEVQKAHYLAQMDFRHCGELVWQLASEKMRRQHFCKIVYPANLKPAVLEFCAQQGIDAASMYPVDPKWEMRIHQIGNVL